ncbi:MAG: DUF4412 domain-containing protein, partial [Thermoanaerobaculia bacterium]
MRTLRIAAAVFFALSVNALAQSEGVAEFRGTTQTDKNGAIPSQGKVFTSKNAVRVEWEMDVSAAGAERKGNKTGVPSNFRMVMIQKLSEPDRTYVLNDQQKTYAVELIDEKRDKATPERTWTVKRLGRDTVAGLSCEKALLTAKNGDETEVCVSTEIIPSAAWLRAWNRREEQSSPLKALNESGIKGFPVRWIFRSGKDKKVSSSVELVAFDRKSLPGSLFEIPPGYRKVGSMMETMMTSDQSKQYQDAMKEMQSDLDKMTPE